MPVDDTESAAWKLLEPATWLITGAGSPDRRSAFQSKGVAINASSSTNNNRSGAANVALNSDVINRCVRNGDCKSAA